MWQHSETQSASENNMPHPFLHVTVDPTEDGRDDVSTAILENQVIVIRTNPSLADNVDAFSSTGNIAKAAADVNEAFIYDAEDDDNDTNPTTWTSSYDDDDDDNNNNASDEQWEDSGETIHVEHDDVLRERDAAQRRVAELEEELGALISATQTLARLVKKKSPSSPTASIADEDEVTLDELIKRWRLEDTGFVSLYSSCRALQSNLALTQAEADAANEEVRAAKAGAVETKSSLTAANKLLRQLWKENVMLKQERRALVRDVKKYVKRRDREARDEIDRTVAFIAHEHSFSSSTSFDRNDVVAIDDELSLSSSLCFDLGDSDCGGSATLHIEGEKMPLGNLLSRSVNSAKSREQSKGVYKITIDNRKEIGIILLPMPINPGRCLAHTCSEAEESPSKKNSIVGLPLVPLDGIGGIGKLFRKQPEVAFVVMGFADIDTCASDKRPLLGSRLVAVDSVSLEGKGHTLKDVCESIRSRDGSVTLSFRNDLMSEQQISYLNEKFGTDYCCSKVTVD
jgi:hypothetical protein